MVRMGLSPAVYVYMSTHIAVGWATFEPKVNISYIEAAHNKTSLLPIYVGYFFLNQVELSIVYE